MMRQCGNGRNGKQTACRTGGNPGIDYTAYVFTPAEWLETIGSGAGIIAVIAWLFYNSWIAAAVMAPLLIFWIKMVRKKRGRERRQKLGRDFGKALGCMAISMRTGHSAERAIADTADNLQRLLGKKSDMAREFSYMAFQLQLRVPAEALLLDLGRRSGIEDIRDFSEVFAAAKRLGGNMNEVIGSAAESLEARMDVEREIETALAAKKMEQKIMTAMPCLIIVYMRIASAGFLDVLYGSAFGVLVMTACLMTYAAAVLWSRKIVDIRV